MNNHIIKYLDYYTSLDISPGYAVMLRGKWGSGKTWFIKEYISSKRKKEFLYVSLYGVTSYTEIEYAFFQQLHPILASKGMKLAGKILKGLIKTTIKVDLDGDGKEDGNVSSGIPDINLPDYMKNVDSKIIVFDDLERCSIAIPNIMGYINQFVENYGLKVIILANEIEILKLDESENIKDNAKSYLTIKEKLIGKSFDITTDFDAAINDFIEQTKNTKSKKLLKDKKHLLKDIFTIAGYNNLRHLRQSILDFERFYEFLPESSKKKEELINDIIGLFFAISFEIKKGKITEDDLKQLFYIDYFSKKKDDEKTEAQIIREKYSVFGLYHHPINEGLWTDFFKNGTLAKESLKESIENSIYFQQENTPNWLKLWHYYDLDDESFEKLFKAVYSEFEHLKIENKYVLIQVTCLLISLSETNLIPNKKKDIIEIAKKNIQNLKEKGGLKVLKNEEFPSDHSHGLGYKGLEIPETIEFLKYFGEEINNTKFEDYPSLAKELLERLSESIELFSQYITLSNSEKNIYYDVPILKFTSAKEFTEVVLKLKNKDMKQLGWILEKRYQYPEFNLKIKDELDWLKEVYEILNKEKDNRKRKISGHIIEFSLLKSLEKCIKQLE
jgi:hypothetical protein